MDNGGREYIVQGGNIQMSKETQNKDLSKKFLLTLEEAASYTGIGINRLRELTNQENCNFVLWVGTRRMLKRIKLEAYLDAAYSI